MFFKGRKSKPGGIKSREQSLFIQSQHFPVHQVLESAEQIDFGLEDTASFLPDLAQADRAKQDAHQALRLLSSLESVTAQPAKGADDASEDAPPPPSSRPISFDDIIESPVAAADEAPVDAFSKHVEDSLAVQVDAMLDVPAAEPVAEDIETPSIPQTDVAQSDAGTIAQPDTTALAEPQEPMSLDDLFSPAHRPSQEASPEDPLGLAFTQDAPLEAADRHGDAGDFEMHQTLPEASEAEAALDVSSVPVADPAVREVAFESFVRSILADSDEDDVISSGYAKDDGLLSPDEAAQGDKPLPLTVGRLSDYETHVFPSTAFNTHIPEVSSFQPHATPEDTDVAAPSHQKVPLAQDASSSMEATESEAAMETPVASQDEVALSPETIQEEKTEAEKPESASIWQSLEEALQETEAFEEPSLAEIVIPESEISSEVLLEADFALSFEDAVFPEIQEPNLMPGTEALETEPLLADQIYSAETAEEAPATMLDAVSLEGETVGVEAAQEMREVVPASRPTPQEPAQAHPLTLWHEDSTVIKSVAFSPRKGSGKPPVRKYAIPLSPFPTAAQEIVMPISQQQAREADVVAPAEDVLEISVSLVDLPEAPERIKASDIAEGLAEQPFVLTEDMLADMPDFFGAEALLATEETAETAKDTPSVSVPQPWTSEPPVPTEESPVLESHSDARDHHDAEEISFDAMLPSGTEPEIPPTSPVLKLDEDTRDFKPSVGGVLRNLVKSVTRPKLPRMRLAQKVPLVRQQPTMPPSEAPIPAPDQTFVGITIIPEEEPLPVARHSEPVQPQAVVVPEQPARQTVASPETPVETTSTQKPETLPEAAEIMPEATAKPAQEMQEMVPALMSESPQDVQAIPPEAVGAPEENLLPAPEEETEVALAAFSEDSVPEFDFDLTLTQETWPLMEEAAEEEAPSSDDVIPPAQLEAPVSNPSLVQRIIPDEDVLEASWAAPSPTAEAFAVDPDGEIARAFVFEEELETSEAVDILASAPLLDEFQMMLIHHEGIFALMVDNGNNAVMLKSFESNPLAQNTTFVITQEAVLPHKILYIVQVGNWQGIIALESDMAVLQAEI